MLILTIKLISSITKSSISKQKRRMLSKVFAKSLSIVKNSPLLFSAKFFKSDKMPSPKRAPFYELERDFLDPKIFYEQLISQDITFFTGVPDSLLKDFCGTFLLFIKKYYIKIIIFMNSYFKTMTRFN